MRLLLYRGGMCGDIIGALLDPTIMDRSKHDNLKLSRTKLKKFWRYTDKEKEDYVNEYLSSDKVLLSHDTDLSYSHHGSTTQLICSNISKITLFAKRFEILHGKHVVDEAKKFLDNQDNFVEDYARSLIDWQNYHTQFNRFDISNIGTAAFLDDLSEFFDVVIDSHVEETYWEWQRQNTELA